MSKLQIAAVVTAGVALLFVLFSPAALAGPPFVTDDLEPMGGYYNFDDGHHLLFSAGTGIQERNLFSCYVAYQWTFGPGNARGETEAHARERPFRPRAAP